MKNTILICVAVLMIPLSGCGGLPKLARALAKDPAIVVIEVNTPYGKQSLIRIGNNTNDVVIKDGTITVNPK